MNEKFNKLKDIKLLLFDMEGVLINNAGDHNTDSLNNIAGLLKSMFEKLRQYELTGGIVTASEDKELLMYFENIPGCEILTSTLDKISLVDKLKEKLSIEYANIFYIGDDLLDIPLLSKVGFSAAPRSSRREVKRVVDYICPADYGESLLEDIGDLFIKFYSE